MRFFLVSRKPKIIPSPSLKMFLLLAILVATVQVNAAAVIVDDGGDKLVGSYPSMISHGVNLMISYMDFTDKKLKFALSSDGGQTWQKRYVGVNDALVTQTDGGGTSLQMINGVPCIAYLSASYDLKVAVAPAADGAVGSSTAWTIVTAVPRGDPVTVTPGYYPSMTTLANGKAIIAYMDKKNIKPYVTVAPDVDPTVGNGNWTTQLLEENPTNFDGPYTQVAIVNGLPAVAYRGTSTDKTIRYVTWAAADASGPFTTSTAWTGASSAPSHLSLISYNNLPMVFFMDNNAGSGVLTVVSIAPGSNTWASETVYTSDGGSVMSIEGAVLGGYPAVGFYDQADRMYRFAVRNATGWTTRIAADFSQNGGQEDLSLLAVDGKPAIAYASAAYDLDFQLGGTWWDEIKPPMMTTAAGHNNGNGHTTTSGGQGPTTASHGQGGGDTASHNNGGTTTAQNNGGTTAAQNNGGTTAAGNNGGTTAAGNNGTTNDDSDNDAGKLAISFTFASAIFAMLF